MHYTVILRLSPRRVISALISLAPAALAPKEDRECLASNVRLLVCLLPGKDVGLELYVQANTFLTSKIVLRAVPSGDFLGL